eukprot:6203434-Pleurochrysis_carterae.AAC.1
MQMRRELEPSCMRSYTLRMTRSCRDTNFFICSFEAAEYSTFSSSNRHTPSTRSARMSTVTVRTGSLRWAGCFCLYENDSGAMTATTVPLSRICIEPCWVPKTNVLLKKSATKSPETTSKLQCWRSPPRWPATCFKTVRCRPPLPGWSSHRNSCNCLKTESGVGLTLKVSPADACFVFSSRFRTSFPILSAKSLLTRSRCLVYSAHDGHSIDE